MFARLLNQLYDRRVTLHLAGLKLPAERVLRAADALGAHPLLWMYRTDAEALAALARLQESPADIAAAAI